jgi:ferric-dicitrate binding protein FerR (iron transport regulator)
VSDPQKLITAYLDDTLTKAERDELAAWLKAQPDHLRTFVEATLFEQQIRSAAGGQIQREAASNLVESELLPRQTPDLVVAESRRPWFYRLWPRLATAGAALLALAVAGVSLWWQHPPAAASSGLARVTRLQSAQGPAQAAAFQTGQKLEPGRLTLVAGAMEITLTNGVVIVFEGPGEIELLTSMRALLHAGQAVVRVPEGARGFRLETAGAQVVDLGTEFGVKCGPGGITDVLVFDGEVMASSAAAGVGFPHQLTAGKGTRFSPDQPQPAEIAYRPERFVRRLPVDKPIEIEEKGSSLFNETRFEEILVLRPARPIVVDGDLSDWSQEGLFRAVREGAPAEFIEGRMRYDDEFLYVAAHLGDPTPMRNIVEPLSDGELGWRGGGLQIRVAADPNVGWPVNANSASYYQMRRLPVDAVQVAQATNPSLAHLTLWHYAPAAQACLHIAFGMDFHGGRVNPPGYRAAYRKDANGRGYSLEYAIPWTLLHAPRAPRSGETMAMSWTAHWSDEGGRLWSGQLVEIRNASEPLRIHTWERAATWGRAVYR